MNDLTVSAIDRQNILNNPLAVEKMQEHLGISGMLLDGEYHFTANLIAAFYEVDRTVRRYVDDYRSELGGNGYQVLKGQKLKAFKAAFNHILEQFEQEQLKDMHVTQLPVI